MKYFFFILGFSLVIFSYGFYPEVAVAQIPDIPLNSIDWNWYDCSSSSGDTGTGTTDTDLPFGLPLALKLRFPFDLVYPVNPQDLNVDSQCLQTSLWGIERNLCAPMQIASIAKNIFLFSYVFKSLMSL